MHRKTLFTGLLALILMGSLVPNALAEIFQKTITMGPGAGVFANSDFGVGDTIVLTLLNPTDRPLTFETTQNIGNQKSWTVGPRSSATVSFNYTRPFDDDVEFVVKDPASPNTPYIAQGTLVPHQTAERPVSMPASSPAVKVQESTPQEIPASRSVRGYW